MNPGLSAIAACDLTPDVAFALETLVSVVERKSGQFRASILLLSDDGQHLLDAAAPSLPASYRQAIHGLKIGPDVGSCGTAAYTNQRIIVTDIQTDPRWTPFRELAAAHNLAACWSQPIRASTNQVLGTFAMYYPEPREPTQEELNIINAAASRAAAMIESARSGATRSELVAGL